MSYLHVEPPAFFHRGPSPAARLVFFGVFSIALLFLDTRYRYLEQVRQVVAAALYPLQRAATVPGELVAGIGAHFESKKALTEENEQLKRQLVEQGAAAQGLESTQRANARLKALLDIKTSLSGNAIAVEVLFSGRDPFTPVSYTHLTLPTICSV